jgi:hypothetical protein
MQLEQLLQVVMDPNLGRGWPREAGPVPAWPVGARWRVEYTFTSPAVSASALALGNEVRAVWRYEVLAHESAADGADTVVLRISPERAGGAGYHILATYDRRTLRLLDARRFAGDRELPLELIALPPLEEEVEVAGGEDAAPGTVPVTRRFTMPEPPAAPELEEIQASVNLGELLEEYTEEEQEV